MVRTSLLLTLLCSACALDPAVDTQTDEIVGGSDTTQWPAIGWLYGTHERCTGTLIAPNIFLTAAHCTDQGLPIHVGFGPYRTGTEIAATRIYRSPNYANADDGSHDVAVLVLATPQWTAPLDVAGSEYPSVTPPGRELRVTGYGDNTSGLTSPDPTPTAPRKTAHVHVDWANNYALGATGINGGTCFGDSGGPLTDLNTTKIYAVSSRLYVPCASDDRMRFAAIAYEGIIGQAIRENPPAPRAWSTPLWRYFNGTNTDHFYTYDRNDAGYAYFGYGYEGSEGRVFAGAVPGTVPLYRYWNPGIGDHFYTTNWGEIGSGAYGYTFERVEGYVFPRSYDGTTPLYRYWNPYGGDHFYTITRNDAGYAYFGYGYEGVVGYVYP